MRDSEVDRNTQGWPVLLRVAGAIVPLVVLMLFVVGRDTLEPFTPAVFRWLGMPWSWPYHAYRVLPAGFGVQGLLTLLFMAGMLVRKDWKGAVIILVWSLFWSWAILSFLITDPS